ncbi:MerR family DNA-binding transcriptional regulator, partial [Amphritea sp. 1_MG-2023]|uniref:MerR family DNA-binding transcriptional regulator n=1 Tax=Amphritea sp. 1_MG-2023 TaxID=3062670 RepID=UPI0026E3BCA9
MAQQFTIGEMAKVGNCKVQTIRYYEEIGMLGKVRISPLCSLRTLLRTLEWPDTRKPVQRNVWTFSSWLT